MKEKAYLIQSLNDLRRLPADATRVYSGSEYCVKAFPKRLKAIFSSLRRERLPFSLLTPPVIESELPLFFEFLDLFEKFVDDSSEIIINDLGILHTLTEKKNTLYKIRLGRFLSYQKRGTQKLYGAVTAEELSYVPILNKKTMDFLIKLGVSGLDIDIPTHNLNIANKPELEIAVYMPYALNSYTINCPFTFNGKSWGRSCKRECLNVKLFYENTETEEPFFQRGKAYYRASMKTISPFINRVVILEW